MLPLINRTTNQQTTNDIRMDDFVHFISCSSAYHHRYWSALYFIYWQHNKKPIHSLTPPCLWCSSLRYTQYVSVQRWKSAHELVEWLQHNEKHSRMWNVMSGNESLMKSMNFYWKTNYSLQTFWFIWKFPSIMWNNFMSCWNLKWFYAIFCNHIEH